MAEKWESDSLRWIHEVRAANYRRTKHIPLRKLPIGLSPEAKALVEQLGLRVVEAPRRTPQLKLDR